MSKHTSATRVGRYFVLGEFAQRGGLLPPRSHVAPIRQLCSAYLDPLRERFGPVTVHSGYRTEMRNFAVGGAPLSFHRYDIHPAAAAADVSCATGTPELWHAFLARLDPGGLGLYASHVHVDNRAVRARW